jgi:hypothetical protein
MQMARCIFCMTEGGPFSTREHILPESLGGGEWAILPDGLLCDACQNKLGSKIEQQALGDYPFSFLRAFLGIPTKKGRAPWFESWEGMICGSPYPGTVGYNPAPFFEKALLEGKKTQIRLLAHPLRRDMVCRFLLKMGIEVIASDNDRDVFCSKFDQARQFALTGKKLGKWWYLQSEKMDVLSRCLVQGIRTDEWASGVRLEVAKLEEGHEMFHLSLLYLDILAPLTRVITPQVEGLKEPEYRLFWI